FHKLAIASVIKIGKDALTRVRPEEPARKLSPSEAASFDKTLARSPRVKSPGVRVETVTHEDGSKTEMHMLGDLLPEGESVSSAPRPNRSEEHTSELQSLA